LNLISSRDGIGEAERQRKTTPERRCQSQSQWKGRRAFALIALRLRDAPYEIIALCTPSELLEIGLLEGVAVRLEDLGG